MVLQVEPWTARDKIITNIKSIHHADTIPECLLTAHKIHKINTVVWICSLERVHCVFLGAVQSDAVFVLA